MACMFESRHVSRHFEKRQRDTAAADKARKRRKYGPDRGARG